MDHAVTAARHFARLVWLLIHDAANVDEQKATLRALAMVVKEGPIALVAEDTQVAANGMVVSTAFSGVTDLTERMTAHGLKGIDVAAAAGPAELLGTARLLAGAHVVNDGGAAAEQQRAALGAGHVAFTTRGVPGALPELELVDVPDDAPSAPRKPRLSVSDVAPKGDGGTGGLFDQFAGGRNVPTASVESLLKELNETTNLRRVEFLLDDLVVLAEQALGDVKPAVLCDILYGIVQRDAATTDTHERRLITMALKRAAKGPATLAVARQLPRAPDRRDEIMAILGRLGDDGADALVEQIASASQQSDRRVYFDALLQLQAGVPHLVHMLGDTRWFVARNAADLLGEMQAKEAEQPLTWLLQHEDDRVRRSATGALMRLGTPRALQAIHDALKDGAPELRILAANALVGRKDVRTAAALVRALEEEKDEEVQTAFLLALGRLGTPDAVARLLETSKPAQGLFKKKPTPLRVAAIQGLAEAKTSDAVAGLNALLQDKESEIRDAATFALGKVKREKN